MKAANWNQDESPYWKSDQSKLWDGIRFHWYVLFFIDATGSGVMLRQPSWNNVLFLEDFQFVYFKKLFKIYIF